MYSSALRDQRRHMLGRFHHRVAMVDDADGDLLVGLDVLEERQVLPVRAGAFDRQDIAGEPQQMGQGTLVARHFPMDAPSGTAADWGSALKAV
jgi:hypothetical protein